MVSGFLKIYDLSNHIQDWQRQGNFDNKNIGLPIAYELSLLPFYFKTEKGLLVSELSIREVSGTRSDKQIGTVTVLTTSWLNNSSGTFNDHWFFSASNTILFPGCGIYEFYIKFDDDSEYISEIFAIPELSKITGCLADYNSDYGNDHLTCN